MPCPAMCVDALEHVGTGPMPEVVPAERGGSLLDLGDEASCEDGLEELFLGAIRVAPAGYCTDRQLGGETECRQPHRSPASYRDKELPDAPTPGEGPVEVEGSHHDRFTHSRHSGHSGILSECAVPSHLGTASHLDEKADPSSRQ